jgi:hypothetical protein
LELENLKKFEYGIDYINYYYKSLSLSMFKSYTMYHWTTWKLEVQTYQDLDLVELRKNLSDTLSYKDFVKNFRWKDVNDNYILDIDKRMSLIK